MGIKYGMLEVHTPSYNVLADKTWHNNKVEYANRHGYKTFEYIVDPSDRPLVGYCKIHAIKEIFNKNPKLEWLWITGTDSMITNFHIKIEDRIDKDYHFIIATDVNGINADSILWRNTKEGRELLEEILSQEEAAVRYGDAEQGAINRILGFPGTCQPWTGNEKIPRKYRKIVKIVPQRRINAYNYDIYGGAYPPPQLDKTNKNGNWQLGDWLIHWPGTKLELRLRLFEHYNTQVIK